jgi:hypothetical protein
MSGEKALDRAALRDRIAEALLDHLSRTADIRPGRDGEPAFMPEVTDLERARIAEVVLAALPAPADRAEATIARVRAVLETEAVAGRSALEYRGLIISALMGTEDDLADEVPEPETEADIVREHVTTVHLIGEQLTHVESWLWKRLAEVRAERPAVEAQPGTPAPAADRAEATIARVRAALQPYDGPIYGDRSHGIQTGWNRARRAALTALEEPVSGLTETTETGPDRFEWIVEHCPMHGCVEIVEHCPTHGCVEPELLVCCCEVVDRLRTETEPQS